MMDTLYNSIIAPLKLTPRLANKHAGSDLHAQGCANLLDNIHTTIIKLCNCDQISQAGILVCYYKLIYMIVYLIIIII